MLSLPNNRRVAPLPCLSASLSVVLGLALGLGVLFGAGLATRPAHAADAPGGAAAKPPARKVLVIVMAQDPNRRGVVEEAFRAQFAALGLEVLTSLGHLSPEDFESQEKLRAKVLALGVDGVFGVAVENVDATVSGGGSVSVGIAAPVSGGGVYGTPYGPYGHSAYVGVSKPVGSGSTTTTARTTARLMFFNEPLTPAWEKVIKNTFNKDDLDLEAAKIAKKTVKELKKQKLIIGG